MKELFIFLGGVATGTAATYFIVKRYYEQVANEEIESVKETYKKNNTSKEKSDSNESRDLTKYADIVDRKYNTAKGEINDSTLESDVVAKGANVHPTEGLEDKPYSITPEEFTILNGFDKVTLTYYEEDETLVNESEESVELSIVGFDKDISAFGEYENDVAYIRNERVSTDYEIILVHSSYEGPGVIEGVDE